MIGWLIERPMPVVAAIHWNERCRLCDDPGIHWQRALAISSARRLQQTDEIGDGGNRSRRKREITVGVARGQCHSAKAERRRLTNPFSRATDRTHLTQQPDLTEDCHLTRERPVCAGREKGGRHGQIESWFAQREPPDKVDEHIAIAEADPGVTLENRE